MANGDAAAAAGMAVMNGTEDRRMGWDQINLTRDYIAQRTSAVQPIAKGGTGQTTVAAARNAFGLGNTAGALPVANGGTGSTTAAAARTALGVPSLTAFNATALQADQAIDEVGSATSTPTPNTLCRFDSGGRIQLDRLYSGGQTFGYTGGQWFTNDQVGIDNNIIVSAVISNAYALTHPVSTGYSSLYVNSDGRYGSTPSALRYKQDITAHGYTLEQLETIQVVSYRLKLAVESNPDAAREVGVIAEQLIEVGLSEFVVFNAAGETQSVAYERLVLVAIGAMQELAARLGTLEARMEALEERMNG